MIPVNEPLLNGNEKKYLAECIDTGWISSEGPFVSLFEKKMATMVGRKHAIAVSNGSVALDTAVEAMGISKGDEVIMPTFTIISCILPVIRAGAIPVFVDSNEKTWNMDVDAIEARITPRTKAIMVVHIYGLPVEMDKVLEIADKYGLKIIEDAAELIGQTYKGKQCGSFGDISTFSFYPNKHITTGEGGMVLTDDDAIAQKCRELRNLCFIPPRRFVHEDLGWNFRMTNLQAALGVAQLERIDEFVQKKREIGKWYNELLKGLESFIDLPQISIEGSENIYWVYGIVLKQTIKFDALEAMKKLSALGIGTRPFFYPMHKQPVLNKKGMYLDEKYPIAENLAERGLYLPSGLALTYNQAKEVTDKLKSILL
jgi:perosamine synthetase